MKHEFKKIKSTEETRYVLETASAGATSSGAVATMPSSVGKVQKRQDNILAQEAGKEKEAPKPRNFVAKNAKMGGAGQHKDKKKAEKQGDTKHKNKSFDMAEGKEDKIAQLKKDHETAVHWSKNETSPQKREAARQKAEKIKGHLEKQYKQGVAEGFNGEYDDEAGMAHSNLLTSARAVMGLLKTIKDRDNLPEWGQEKIAKAEMMLVSVWDYLQSQKQMGNNPQVEAYGRYDRRDAYQRDYDHSIAGMDRGNNHRDDERHDLDPSDWYIVKDGKMFKVSVYPSQEQEAISRGYSRTRDEAKANAKQQGVAEAAEDRTSYQVAKILSDRGIKYDPAQENELINAIGMVLVKELMMSPKQARHLISYDEDFVSDTLGELQHMEQGVAEKDDYMESLTQSLNSVLGEKAVSKAQQRFMGMVHAAKKGEKAASPEVAKAAKGMGKKDAKDFAATKHKGLPEKKKSKN